MKDFTFFNVATCTAAIAVGAAIGTWMSSPSDKFLYPVAFNGSVDEFVTEFETVGDYSHDFNQAAVNYN